MTKEAYYGASLARLDWAKRELLGLFQQYPAQEAVPGVQPILYCKARIKEPDSIIQKLKRYGLPTDSETALARMHDAVGVRVVCSFLSDVSAVADWTRRQPDLTVLEEKDYIQFPKPNGYRSLHLIVRLESEYAQNLLAEIQIRTIAIDSWAALEHQMKYKRVTAHDGLIRSELKRCADEIASTDLSMQILREWIDKKDWKE